MNLNKHLRDTARAWGIPFWEVQSLREWVEENVDQHARWSVFVGLLRKKRGEHKND